MLAEHERLCKRRGQPDVWKYAIKEGLTRNVTVNEIVVKFEVKPRSAYIALKKIANLIDTKIEISRICENANCKGKIDGYTKDGHPLCARHSGAYYRGLDPFSLDEKVTFDRLSEGKQKAVLEKLRLGCPYSSIAFIFGLNPRGSMTYIKERYGIEKSERKFGGVNGAELYSDDESKIINKMLKRGKTARQISKKIDRPAHSIYQYLRKKGTPIVLGQIKHYRLQNALSSLDPSYPVDKNWRSDVHKGYIDEFIRMSLSEGLVPYELAARFGLPLSRIKKVGKVEILNIKSDTKNMISYLYKMGLTISEVADEVGYSEAYCKKYIRENVRKGAKFAA